MGRIKKVKNKLESVARMLVRVYGKSDFLEYALLSVLPSKTNSDKARMFQFRFKKLCMSQKVDASALIALSSSNFRICGEMNSVSLTALSRSFALYTVDVNSKVKPKDRSETVTKSGIIIRG